MYGIKVVKFKVSNAEVEVMLGTLCAKLVRLNQTAVNLDLK